MTDNPREYQPFRHNPIQNGLLPDRWHPDSSLTVRENAKYEHYRSQTILRSCLNHHGSGWMGVMCMKHIQPPGLVVGAQDCVLAVLSACPQHMQKANGLRVEISDLQKGHFMG